MPMSAFRGGSQHSSVYYSRIEFVCALKYSVLDCLVLGPTSPICLLRGRNSKEKKKKKNMVAKATMVTSFIGVIMANTRYLII